MLVDKASSQERVPMFYFFRLPAGRQVSSASDLPAEAPAQAGAPRKKIKLGTSKIHSKLIL